MDFDDLRKIQLELRVAASEKIESDSKLTFVENRKQLYDLFDLKNNDLLTCLPPKVIENCISAYVVMRNMHADV